jgi:hypothetical protein
MTSRVRLLAASAALVLAPRLALAGPPLVCFPIDIGAARSLPWGSGPGWNVPLADYDRARLVSDTLELLTPSTPVLVRMETLRRATVYAARDAGVARELLARVEARARDSSALALFDAGYLIETYKQARAISGREMVDPARDGYAMVKEALARLVPDPALEYAAALVAIDGRKEASRRHFRKASEGAPKGSLLARNIEAHHALWNPRVMN